MMTHSLTDFDHENIINFALPDLHNCIGSDLWP